MVKDKILIIEDDKFLVRLLEGSIDRDKFEVIMALDAEEGITKAVKEQPALIVLDIILPSQNGFECLKKLKELKETRKIPVMILSNLGQDDEIRKGLRLGAIGYMVKSNFKVDEVISKIVSLIEENK